jgi:hypothetical protein
MYTQICRYVDIQNDREIIVHLVIVFTLYVHTLCRGTLEIAGDMWKHCHRYVQAVCRGTLYTERSM